MVTAESLGCGDVNALTSRHRLISSQLPGPVSAVLVTYTLCSNYTNCQQIACSNCDENVAYCLLIDTNSAIVLGYHGLWLHTLDFGSSPWTLAQITYKHEVRGA